MDGVRFMRFGMQMEDGKWNVTQTTFYFPLTVAAALILKRQILRNGFAARLSILYAPKGPLLDWTNEP